MENMLSAFASTGALIISLASFIFAVLSWRENHRPIVTARINPLRHSCVDNNPATLFELIVENSGNRPAINVQLHPNKKELHSALIAPKEHPFRNSVMNCFNKKTFIPVLEPTKYVKNSFGALGGSQSTWKHKAIIHITVKYEDLKGRKFSDCIPIWLVNNKGFALSYYIVEQPT